MVQPEPNTYDKQLVALGRVLQTLREEANSDVLIETVLSYLRSEFDYAVIWLGLYDRLEHRLVGKGGITPAGETHLLRQRMTLKPGDVLEQVVIQQRPLAIPDLREEIRAGEWRQMAQQMNVQGTLLFPVRHQNQCYGVALLGSSHWGISPRSDEKARLSIILGELAAALNRIEQDWQRQQIKRPEQPLLALLSKLRSLSGLGPRLEAVVEETHQFIEPTRTSVYWFERERRYFWRRVSNRSKTSGLADGNPSASGITVQEVSGFYQALMADQLVSIGEAHSSLKADITGRLMQQIRARSLLAAPILIHHELLGFLAVEGKDARIWTEAEKDYIRGAAQIIALTAPLDEMEAVIEQVKLDQAITTEVAHSIYSEEDWKETLKQAADKVCRRLKAERFLVLVYDTDQNCYDMCYQSHPTHRRPLGQRLEPLSDMDSKLLTNSDTGAIAIENLDSDLRFLPWRNPLLELGIRSFIVCSTSLDHSTEGMVLVCHESARSWSYAECSLVRVVSRQIGLILHQWQLQKQNEQQQKISQSIQWGLTTMQQTAQLEQLEQSALQHLAQVLHVPLAALIGWLPGHTTGHLVAPLNIHNERFTVRTDLAVPIYTDMLVGWALASDGLLGLNIDDIPPDTRQWLNGRDIGQILVMALRTAPEHEPTGIVIVADGPERRWAERHLAAFGTLVSQLAWSRRHVHLIDLLTQQRANLERLNWYKHRRLEDTYRSLAAGLKRLTELSTSSEPLATTRQQQTLRQLTDLLTPVGRLIQDEPWQLRSYPTTLPLISLLKRALERVDSQIKQRQLWSQVHNETNLTIAGDITKIELVLYEVLLTACQRSNAGGRLDIWCRQIDSRWFELSITDNGTIEPRLLAELESGRGADWLAPSILDHPPGLHLLVCQAIIQQIGGEMNLYKLEDNRILTRLVLPLASAAQSPKA